MYFLTCFCAYTPDRHSPFMVPMFCPGGCWGMVCGANSVEQKLLKQICALRRPSCVSRKDACDMSHSVEAAMMRARGAEMFCPRIATKTCFLKR